MPQPFDLDRTVRGEPWLDLAPWRYDRDRRVLGRPLRLGGGRIVYAEVAEAPGGLAFRALSEGRLPAASGREALAAIRAGLALGAERRHRSPDAFEDAVKTLCTTRAPWTLARSVASRLCAELGEPAPAGARCFPTAEAMAARPERFYRDVIGAEALAAPLADLARRFAEGDPPVG